jgi:hypothetical protein
MALPDFRRQVVHTPTTSEPQSNDQTINIALVIDNPGGFKTDLQLVWQYVDTANKSDWMIIPDAAGQAVPIWGIAGMGAEPTFTHATGESFKGTFEQIVQHFGASMITGYVHEINDRLAAFFANAPEGTTPMTAMDILYAALREWRFQNGTLVRV